MHVLDNPVWHALTGTHATVAERAGLAARYQPQVAVFAGLADDPTAQAWSDLAELVGAGGTAFLARRDVKVLQTWNEQFRAPCLQMWLPDHVSDRDDTDDLVAPFVRLGAGDVPQMLALVERTRPGPFATRTVELGTYLGIRDGDELIAMAGERLHPPGFTEISAVCTDVGYRGKGLASKLVRAVARGIRSRGETPFLHLTVENDAARRVYSDLGFETRTNLSVLGLQAPG
jgi:predicted GNAT family acetyltransferase